MGPAIPEQLTPISFGGEAGASHGAARGASSDVLCASATSPPWDSLGAEAPPEGGPPEGGPPEGGPPEGAPPEAAPPEAAPPSAPW